MNTIIKTYVDNSIEWLRQQDLLNSPDDNMPIEMYDNSKSEEDDNKPWKPIPSTVTDEELLALENKIGHKFPNSYKEFLKYNHFYELHSADGFQPFENVIHRWKETLSEHYYEGDLKEFMLDKGYIWFGEHEDLGFLCFDTNAKSVNDNEYPVVNIDYDVIDKPQKIYKNFLECLTKNTLTI